MDVYVLACSRSTRLKRLLRDLCRLSCLGASRSLRRSLSEVLWSWVSGVIFIESRLARHGGDVRDRAEVLEGVECQVVQCVQLRHGNIRRGRGYRSLHRHSMVSASTRPEVSTDGLICKVPSMHGPRPGVLVEVGVQ